MGEPEGAGSGSGLPAKSDLASLTVIGSRKSALLTDELREEVSEVSDSSPGTRCLPEREVLLQTSGSATRQTLHCLPSYAPIRSCGKARHEVSVRGDA